MRIGLALEAGGVKGVAHIALLEKLESIDIEIVTGSSMGAVIGALFALSGDSKTVKEKLFSTLKRYLPVFRNKIKESETPWFSLFQKSLVKVEEIYPFFRDLFDRKKFSDCKKKLGVVVFDSVEEESVLVTEGFLVDAVLASSSVPGFFEPLWLGGAPSLDGGVLCPVPVREARILGADFVIASIFEDDIPPPTDHVDMLFKLADWKGKLLKEEDMKLADYVITHRVSYDWTDFENYREVYKEAKANLEGFEVKQVID
ncbi:MAG: Patatin [Thermotoga sp. 4484_232]|nr:MAG: Patatin [Thermotoga sp. 4484_232]